MKEGKLKGKCTGKLGGGDRGRKGGRLVLREKVNKLLQRISRC